MPSGYDYLREGTLEFASCVVEVISSEDIFDNDEEKIYLKVVEVLEGNPNLLGESFTIDYESYDIDEDNQLFKAELQISEDQQSYTSIIKCTSLEEYHE